MSELALYRSFLHQLGEKSPEDERLMQSALAAYDEMQQGKVATDELVRPLVEAASDKRKTVFEIPVDLLDRLTATHEVARMAVEKMLVDSRSHVRFNSIMCIGKGAPLDFRLRMIRKGLQDRSATNRRKAAEWGAWRQRIREIIPDLEAAIGTEKDSKTRDYFRHYLALLRDGYVLRSDPSGTWVETFNGARFVQSVAPTAQEIDRVVSDLYSPC